MPATAPSTIAIISVDVSTLETADTVDVSAGNVVVIHASGHLLVGQDIGFNVLSWPRWS